MDMQFIPINLDLIDKQTDRFSITINKTTLIMEFSWNDEESAFFIDVFDSDLNPILYGRKLVHGEDIFEAVIDDRLPEGIRVIPLDKSGLAEAEGITFENFISSIKLYIVGDTG